MRTKILFTAGGSPGQQIVFELLSKNDYQGLIIFQAFRDDEGIEIFKEQLNWFLKKANA